MKNFCKYGLSDTQISYALQKIKNQRNYLENNFIRVGRNDIPLSNFFKNAYINSNRYISEINARVYSLYNYAKSHNLHNIFITLTLPSEYHKMKTVKGKLVPNENFIDDENHTPNAGSKMLTKLFHSLLFDRSLKNLPITKKVYFRVTEPHKDGTPHLHISLFVPKENIDRIVKAIKRKFPFPQSKIEINVNNPVAYLMKYILKTLDDLRLGEDKYTNLSLWYIANRITRLYTSRTLISLDVYRVLGGRYTLNELTYMYKNRELSVLLNPDTKKIEQINIKDDLIGFVPIYNRKVAKKVDYKVYDSSRPSLKSKIKKDLIPVDYYGQDYFLIDGQLRKKIDTFIPARASDYSLYNYYHSLDIEDPEISLLHYGIVQNEMINRGLLDDVPINNLNDFSLDFYDVY